MHLYNYLIYICLSSINLYVKMLFVPIIAVSLLRFKTISADEDPRLNTRTPNFKQYCIIGAGPGGLQMAYFLHQSNRDYIVYEKGHGAGTFYLKYPIHRQLISINKRHTGKTNKEFNMRHDWNSLLSHDESLRMTKYSKDFFPPADVLVKYLNDYMKKLNLNVRLNTTISNILKRNDELFQMQDQHNRRYTCKYIIAATGVSSPNAPHFYGSDLVEGYENLSINRSEFEGQSVLILGRGNSAFETAQHILGSTNFVHMVSRDRVKLSWSTHYVGDLRAVNNGLLDTYQLKSLDGTFETDVKSITLHKSPLNGKIFMTPSKTEDTFPGGESIDESDNNAVREGYDRVIRCLGFKFDMSIFHPLMPLRHAGRTQKKYPRINFSYESLDVKNLFFAGVNTHSLDYKKSAGGFIHGYRYTTRVLHRLLEWKNFKIPWPHVLFKNTQNLLSHLMKRINEASDLYQMFSVLCDVVIFNEKKTESTYLEAFPCALISKLPMVTGHQVPESIVVMSFEYGKNFSGPGKDVFFEDRAISEARKGYQSNFLHPVLYYYEKLFSVNTFINKPSKWLLPVPDDIHHIVEDFTTKFDGHKSHILQTRRFLERITKRDQRYWFADQCLKLALTFESLPYGCSASEDQSSERIKPSQNLAQSLSKMPKHLLPFLDLKVR